MRDVYRCFAELALHHREGRDFDRSVLARQHAQVVVMAPHGGRLENHTDTIAERIAGSDFSLYCFRSRLGWGKTNLHITSHRFDDPDCVALVERHRWAVAVHGCSQPGELVFLGGRDEHLRDDLAQSLRQAGIRAAVADHPYPGRHPQNICNRTSSRAGVQVELTMPFRLSGAVPALVEATRAVLLSRQRTPAGGPR